MSRAQLTQHQWQLLVDTLAEYCDATDGTREDLHDHAAGILHTTRPPEWESSIEDGPAHELWRHTYTVIGALAHLADAAPHDTRQLHTLGHQVADLAHRLLSHQEPIDV